MNPILEPIFYIVSSFFGCIMFLSLLVRIPFVKRSEANRWNSQALIPTLGGIALLMAGVYPILAVDSLLVYGALLIFLTGLMDDIVVYPAPIKFFFQVVASIALVVARFGLHGDLFLMSAAFLLAMTLINAMNFIDNMNGVAAIVACNAFVAFGFSHGNYIDLRGAGACIAFLLYNLRGKIYMGDCGSMLLGYTLAWLCVSQPVIVWQQSLLIMAFPLADIMYVTVNRLYHGRKPWVGGTDHLNHIIARQFDEEAAILFSFIISMALGLFGFSMSFIGN